MTSLVAPFFGVAALFSALGVGGGAIYVPLLLVFGLPLYNAAATSQVLIIAATLSPVPPDQVRRRIRFCSRVLDCMRCPDVLVEWGWGCG